MICPNCQIELSEIKHKILKDKDLSKPYFFLKWYKCQKCNYMKTFDDDKIFNHTTHFNQTKEMRRLNLIN